MAINKARLIASMLGTNSLVSFDSDAVITSYNAPTAVGVKTYSSIDDLPSTAVTGEKALVTSINALYLYNSGWYKIALVNNTPYWSTEANSSYDLSTTGAVTTITILAVDSEGVNPVYTATGDSGFNAIATVVKDSDNGRIFTVTPIDSENGTAIAGTGTVTFKASDGVNLATTLSTFSIAFKVQNSNYTTLLIQADSDGTDNQVDASTNAHTITEVDNVSSTAFTPFHPGGYSTYFDGTSNSNIQIKGEPRVRVGTNDFSVSFWYKGDLASNRVIASSVATAVSGVASQLYWNVSVRSNGAVWLQTRSSANSGLQKWGRSAAGRVTANKWHHVTVSRQNGWHYVAIDGVQDTSAYRDQATFNLTAQELAIGLSNITAYESYGKGYVRDFNFCVGASEYDLNVGDNNVAYTVPDEPITPHTNTKFLLSGLPYIVDSSANDLTLDVIGSSVTKLRDGPYDYLGYDKTDHGGSVYFDGTGDHITAPQAVPNSLSYQSDFTIEGWFYATDLSSQRMIAAAGSGTQTSNIRVTSDGKLYFQIYFSSGNHTLYTTPDANKIKENNWHHIAFVHNYGDSAVPNEYTFYVDGKNIGSTTTAINSYGWYNGVPMGPLYVGKHSYNNSAYWLGYISDFRIVNSLVYDSEFTPPTAPLTAITDTQLLTCTNKNDIWDRASGSLLTKVGNATVSDTQRKFTSSSAMYFDGTGDYAEIKNLEGLQFGTNDFTVEGWVWKSAQGANGYDQMVGIGQTVGATTGWYLEVSTDRGIYFTINNSTVSYGTWSNDSTWHHIAVTRSSGTVNIWLDGTSVANGTISGSVPTTGTTAKVGNYFNGTTSYTFNGYIQDLRITKGLARYTTNFTAPSAQSQG